MKHSKLLITPSEALLRVYAPRAHLSSSLLPSRTTARHASKISRQEARRLPTDFKLPPLHPSGAKRLALQEESDKLAHLTIDNQITNTYVQVKRPDNEALDPPRRLEQVIDQISRDEIVLELSSTAEQPNTSVVRITTRAELLEQANARAQALKDLQKSTKQGKSKQIEINWAISSNDLAIKLKQLGEFLEKGRKVEVLLANKKRQRRASAEEGEGVLKRIRGRLEEMEAKEGKEMEGDVGGQATLFVQKR